jgi:DNA-binding MarR family transcriptional regulator
MFPHNGPTWDMCDRTANVLGALALVIADRMTDAVADAAGHSVTTASALSALHQFLDRPSIDLLRQVLGLTSSGTVRLVDRLESDGYVTRGPGGDRRSTAVELTPAGRQVAARVAAARAAVLSDVLGTLTTEELQALDGIAARLVVGMMRGPGATRWICRLCDMQACGHQEGHCPIVEARCGDAAT